MKKDRLERMRRSGLAFFGEVTASVTHEIKNSLAVIKEVSGLMDDLAAGARMGRPLIPERIKELAGRIDMQVGRADGSIRRLNRFAHSVDHPRRVVDLSDLLGMLSGLAERWAHRNQVQLTSITPERVISIETDPFLFEHAVFLALRGTIEEAKPETEVVVTLEAAGDGARIILKGTPERVQPVRRSLKEILGLLGAGAEADPAAGLLTLDFPRLIPGEEDDNG